MKNRHGQSRPSTRRRNVATHRTFGKRKQEAPPTGPKDASQTPNRRPIQSASKVLGHALGEYRVVPLLGRPVRLMGQPTRFPCGLGPNLILEHMIAQHRAGLVSSVREDKTEQTSLPSNLLVRQRLVTPAACWSFKPPFEELQLQTFQVYRNELQLRNSAPCVPDHGHCSLDLGGYES